MTKLPNNSLIEGNSLKKATPIKRAQSSEEYLNGAEKEISPKRTAATEARYPNPMNNAAADRIIWILTGTVVHSLKQHATPVATVICKAVRKATLNEEIFSGIFKVTRSLKTSNNTDIKANME